MPAIAVILLGLCLSELIGMKGDKMVKYLYLYRYKYKTRVYEEVYGINQLRIKFIRTGLEHLYDNNILYIN